MLDLPKRCCWEKIAGLEQSFSPHLAKQPCEKAAESKQAARAGRKRSRKTGALWIAGELSPLALQLPCLVSQPQLHSFFTPPAAKPHASPAISARSKPFSCPSAKATPPNLAPQTPKCFPNEQEDK